MKKLYFFLLIIALASCKKADAPAIITATVEYKFTGDNNNYTAGYTGEIGIQGTQQFYGTSFDKIITANKTLSFTKATFEMLNLTGTIVNGSMSILVNGKMVSQQSIVFDSAHRDFIITADVF